MLALLSFSGFIGGIEGTIPSAYFVKCITP